MYAIAAGNAVIIKPSEFASATSTIIKEMIGELFPENEVAVIEGELDTASALLNLPFHHIFITGSPAVGKIVMSAAAKHLTSVTLELGGKSPVVIDETVNLKTAAEKIVWAKTMNCGQTCIAPDYLLIQESVKEEFVKYHEIAIKKFYNRDESGIEKSKNYARIINRKNFNRVKTLVEDAVENGGRIISGGQFDEATLFVAPTLIDNVTDKMAIMNEEIFGPVLPVLTFKKIEDAVSTINRLPKPLTSYILSSNKRNINYLLNNTSSGGTMINDLMLTSVNPHLPFGGINNSGIGKSNGLHSFIAFSNERGILKRNFGTNKIVFPPYNKTIIDWILKIARL
jgi:aldehyde dehydrogenase (NAD+)